jgi:site-specific DNA recombinase
LRADYHERTRDKIAATRRKGKYAGGRPVLGYDVDAQRSRLVVNDDEAARVRAIFQLYLEKESLLPVVRELERRGWRNKTYTTRAGRQHEGESFTRTNLYRLLTNVVYAGKVRYKDEVHPGEHPALVDESTWQRVQTLLARNGRSGGAAVRNQFRAVLKGLLRCAPCGHAMTPTHTTRGGAKRYRYYACVNAQKRGAAACLTRTVPAAEIERVVIEQVQRIGRDPALVTETLRQARMQDQQRLVELDAERRTLERDLARWSAELRELSGRLTSCDDTSAAVARLADLQDRIAMAERRLHGLREQTRAIGKGLVREDEVAQALARFDPVWQALSPREQGQILRLLIERVDFDGATGKVAITFRPSGIKTLSDELNTYQKEMTA